MEPNRQMEIQLGHMCNNRCVFCVSGQRTARREAFPLEADPILQKIREAYDGGMRKLTLLGGEPTIQPEFINILKAAVAMGFEEIVIFTNGVKTARPSFMDEILSIGGNFTFRFSFQGANEEAHERTTKKDGSFKRLVDSLRNAHVRNQRVTVNMCVVQSNYESVADFPALILPYGATQLHLDMIRPLDAGERTEQEMRDMLPHYPKMVPYLEQMIAGFPPGFDVNIGNLPYCVAPKLAKWIHHDGEQTFTVAIDEDDKVSEAWNKYEVKRCDKIKKPSCAQCVFNAQCSGVFETYRDFYGMDELQPITLGRLAEIDPKRELLTLHLGPAIEAVKAWTPPEPYKTPFIRIESHGTQEVAFTFEGPAGLLSVALRPPGSGGIAATNIFSMHLLEAPDAGPYTLRLLRSLLDVVSKAVEARVIHPVGEDAAFLADRPPRLGALMDARLGTWLRLLRKQAPFGGLAWKNVSITGAGREATLSLVDSNGTEANVTLTMKGNQIGGGYKLVRPDAPASPELVEGLRSLFGVLRAPPGASAQARV